MRKITLVTTTINVPKFLEAYSKNADRFGHVIDYIVVGDIKSDPDTASFCERIPKCTYVDLVAQMKFMAKFPELNNFLPFNSIERGRNVGMLMAYSQGSELVLMIDDDNLATGHDFVGMHSIVDTTPALLTYHSTNGWFNVCSALREKNGIEFYHRGYPRTMRWVNGLTTAQPEANRVIVNAGLWLGDPDIDAITRLERGLITTGLVGEFTFALSPGTWSPFDNQNTAIARDAIPAYFLSPHVGRYSDIWASYIITRLAEHFNDVITFGRPICDHDRGTRDLLKDLDGELMGYVHTEKFVDILRSTQISEATYGKGFLELMDGLAAGRYEHKVPTAIGKYVEGMRLWHQAIKDIDSGL